MKEFAGFPARMDFSPIPRLFLNRLMPEMDDPAELKLALLVFSALYGKKGYPRYVSSAELRADPAVLASLKSAGKSIEMALPEALNNLVKEVSSCLSKWRLMARARRSTFSIQRMKGRP